MYGYFAKVTTKNDSLRVFNLDAPTVDETEAVGVFRSSFEVRQTAFFVLLPGVEGLVTFAPGF